MRAARQEGAFEGVTRERAASWLCYLTRGLESNAWGRSTLAPAWTNSRGGWHGLDGTPTWPWEALNE